MNVTDPSGGPQMLSTDRLHTDPDRFQARSSIIEDVCDSDLSDVTAFKVNFAGVISVWRDASDGRIFVVDGHRRLDLACRTRTSQLLVQFLSCATAGEAFGRGILINIAQWIFDSNAKVEKACACRRAALERAFAERRLDSASEVAEELFEYFPDLRQPRSGADPSVASPPVESRPQKVGSDEAPSPTDVLFLTVFHNLPGVSNGYNIDYYQPADWERLRLELTSAVNLYLPLFSESWDYEDYFSCADYGIDDESFDESETAIFRSALDPGERKDPLSDLHPRDIFRGCCAVIDARLNSADFALIQSGISLFNLVMEGALPTDDSSNPQCYIKLQTAKEFAPKFIDLLFEAVNTFRGGSLGVYRPSYLGEIREAFQPLQPLMAILKTAVQRESWPRSDLDIGRLLLLVDHYQQVMAVFEGTTEP